MIKRFLLAAAAVCLLVVSGCTPSETTCMLAEELKLTFDDFAADGEFSRDTVVYVNATYDEGIKVCTAPPGTYDHATVISTAGKMVRIIRRAMRESDRAAVVMYPQIRNLERMLDHAR